MSSISYVSTGGHRISIPADAILTLITENGTRFDILLTGKRIQIFLIPKVLETIRIIPCTMNLIKLEAAE